MGLKVWEKFLSHLSGDEGFIEATLLYAKFLSHLSGDEEYKLQLSS